MSEPDSNKPDPSRGALSVTTDNMPVPIRHQRALAQPRGGVTVRTKIAAAIVAALLLFATPALAQNEAPGGDPRDVVRPALQGGGRQGFFGVRGGVFSEEGEYAGPLVGIEGGFPLSSDRLFFNPNVEFAVADSFVLTVNGDFIFVLTPRSTAQLWIGAGVGYMDRRAFLRADRSGLVGNLLLGVGMGSSRVRPYVQAKAILGEESHWSFVFGVRF